MSDRDEQMAQIKAQMHEQLEGVAGERVLAFGFFGDASYWESQPGRYSPADGNPEVLVRGFKRLFGGKRVNLPTQAFLAVTPTRILLVAGRARRAAYVPGEVLRAWDRADTVVEVGDDPTWTEIALEGSDDDRPSRLRSTDHQGTGVNAEVLALLRG